MITIKLIGGAKKSFNSDELKIDESDISINKILELLLKTKPEMSNFQHDQINQIFYYFSSFMRGSFHI